MVRRGLGIRIAYKVYREYVGIDTKGVKVASLRGRLHDDEQK